MAHAAPRHVGEVQEAVDAAEIDEGAEVGDVLDDAFAHLARLELAHEALLQLLALLFEHDAARHHDVAAALVDLDDLEVERLADEVVEIGHLAQRDLGAGQEGVDAQQVDDEAALDAALHAALHDLVRCRARP